MAHSVQAPVPFILPIADDDTRNSFAGKIFRALSRVISAPRIDALIDSRQRLAEAKIAHYLARQGTDRLTDGMEREISRLL